MKLSFEFSMEDWLAFQAQCMNNSKEFQRLKMAVKLSLPILLTILFVVQLWLDLFTLVSVIVYFIASALWIQFYPSKFEADVLKRTRKMIDTGDNRILFGTHTIELTSEQLIMQGPGSNSTVNWSMISKIEETETYFFIYLTAISACIIPKEKIEKDVAELRVFLKTKGLV